MEGSIFTDGSCTRRFNSEFNRAAWAAVQIDSTGALQAVLKGIVPRTLPQTPQAAEYLAAAAATEVTTGETSIYIDCKGVVEALNKTRQEQDGTDVERDVMGRAKKSKTHGSRMHAAAVNQTRQSEGWEHIREYKWTKAHVLDKRWSEERRRQELSKFEADKQWEILANEQADYWADSACEQAEFNRQDNLVIEREYEPMVRQATAIANTIGATLACWKSNKQKANKLERKKKEYDTGSKAARYV